MIEANKKFFLEGESPTLIIYEFFSKYNKTGVFKQSGIGNEHAASFQNKMYIKIQKI